MFFANFKMKFFISNFFVGNTPLGLSFKETFKDILISSVVLPIHLAKVCIYGNLHYVALNYFVEYIYKHALTLRSRDTFYQINIILNTIITYSHLCTSKNIKYFRHVSICSNV